MQDIIIAAKLSQLVRRKSELHKALEWVYSKGILIEVGLSLNNLQ